MADTFKLLTWYLKESKRRVERAQRKNRERLFLAAAEANVDSSADRRRSNRRKGN